MKPTVLQYPEGSEANGPFYLKMLLNDKSCSKLFTRTSSALSSIAGSTHVSMRMSGATSFFPNTTERVLLISGDAFSIESSLKLVLEKTAQGPAEGHVLQMLVPNNCVSAIIGPGGDIIRNLANVSGASIKISPPSAGATERVVRIACRSGVLPILTSCGSISETVFREGGSFNTTVCYDKPAATTTAAKDTYMQGFSADPEAEAEAAWEAEALPLDEIKIDSDQLLSHTPDSEELVCKICHSYILGCAPKLTKCQHTFCGDCLEEWGNVQPKLLSWLQVARTAGQARQLPCPVCKTALNDKTDVFLISPVSSKDECSALFKRLSKLQVKCHNHLSVTKDGKCDWIGGYCEYQGHAKLCAKNSTSAIAAPNTSVAMNRVKDGVPEEQVAVIPFGQTEQYTIQVKHNDRLLIEERSDNGLWIYGKNITTGNEGWFPDYCTKKYSTLAEYEASQDGKQVERCAIVKDFDAKQLHGNDAAVALSVREGEVVIVVQRLTGSTWNLVISSDGLRQGWVPDNRCKTIREGSDASSTNAVSRLTQPSTFVARRAFDAEGRPGELQVAIGDIVSVRQTQESGWTLGVVVAGGSKKEGWFPDWVLDRGTDKKDGNGKCCNCGIDCVAVGFVKVPNKAGGEPTQGPICSASCWEKWIKRVTTLR